MVSYTTLIIVAVVVWWLATQAEQSAVTRNAALIYQSTHPLTAPIGSTPNAPSFPKLGDLAATLFGQQSAASGPDTFVSY